MKKAPFLLLALACVMGLSGCSVQDAHFTRFFSACQREPPIMGCFLQNIGVFQAGASMDREPFPLSAV